MRSIFYYNEYRSFLKDFYQSQKKNKTGYTYAKFAAAARLNSSNYLKLVIDGTRNLTITNIHQFSQALNLDFDERVYFEALVLKEQATTNEETKYYSQRLNKLKKQNPSRGFKVNKSEFVSNWYMPAILVCLQGQSESVDLGEMASLIGISKFEFEEGLRQLREKKVIEIREGKYSFDGNYAVYHDPKQSNQIQKNYLKTQMNKSLEAFQKKYDKGAKFYSHTFSIPKSEFSFCESQINSFVQSLIAKVDTPVPEKLVQLNLQLFPLGMAEGAKE